jgi:hypothetical protein
VIGHEDDQGVFQFAFFLEPLEDFADVAVGEAD